MHPTIEQFCRVRGVSECQPEFFRRTQRELRDTVQPLLDDRDRLAEENTQLKAQIEKLSKKTGKTQEAA